MNIAKKSQVVVTCRDCKEVLNRVTSPRIYWKFNHNLGKIEAVCGSCEAINEHYKLHEQMETTLHQEREPITHIEYLDKQ